MAVTPLDTHAQKLNLVSAQVDQNEKDFQKDQRRIVAIDSGLFYGQQNLDILQCQLEVLQNSPFEQIHPALVQKMNALRDRFIDDYGHFIAQKEHVIYEGKQIALESPFPGDPSVLMKDHLIHEFKESTQQRITQVLSAFQIAQSIDIASLEQKLTQEREKQEKIIQQLFQSKTERTNEMYEKTQTPEKIRSNELKIELQTGQTLIANIWDAAEKNDCAYLQAAISKLWFFQSKSDFINQKNEGGFTPLHLASAKGQKEAVQFLLENAADPLSKDQEGYSPIHWAAKYGHLPVVSLFLEKKAPLVHAQGAYQRTPLHMAAYNGHARVAEVLLQKGADLNAQTTPEEGANTPLHDAITMDKTDIVQILCSQKNLDVNRKNAQQCTPLYLAVMSGNLEIIALLISHPKWQTPSDKNDPNHISQLLRLERRGNKEKVDKLLSNLAL